MQLVSEGLNCFVINGFICLLYRLCCSTAAIQNKIHKQFFSSKALKEYILGRLSLALDLPVGDSDGLSKVFCLPCVRKIESKEAFRRVQRTAPVRSAAKKRTKDTNGSSASLFTVSSCPSAKRSTIGLDLLFLEDQPFCFTQDSAYNSASWKPNVELAISLAS